MIKTSSKTIQKLYSKTITIVMHEATTGAGHGLLEFLIQHAKKVFLISHPLLFIPSTRRNSSYWQLYVNNKLQESGKAYHWQLPELILYLKDFLYSFFWVATKLKNTDIFFGVGNINAIAGLLLKKFGFVDTVIFYCIDYVPKRFNNSFLNSFYHWIDKIAVKHCDATWNLSPRMAEGREKKWGKKFGNQITVPIGLSHKQIVMQKIGRKNKHEIIYVGTILEKQGLDMCIEAVNKLKNTIKDIRFTIIGTGPYENVLKSLVDKYKLNQHVKFLGYIKNHEDVEKRLSMATLALALYNPKKDFFTYYADPMKVKIYLACGLPVLITDVPYIAKQTLKEKCGIIVSYKLSDITVKIEQYLKNPEKIYEYSKNALKFTRQYDSFTIYAKALGASL